MSVVNDLTNHKSTITSTLSTHFLVIPLLYLGLCDDERNGNALYMYHIIVLESFVQQI